MTHHPPLTVVVPTFNRLGGLLTAVRSLYAQTLVDAGFTIVIVDNAPNSSAATAIQILQAECPETLKLVTLHEPNAGVANARNTAMSAVETDLVAFLDDDQSAPENWLETLLAAYTACPAAVTFGPVITALPEVQKHHREYFSGFFAREPDHASGYITQFYGCGNALVDFSQISGTSPWFDTAMNEVGGEDDRLFERVRQSGGQFGWAADAIVFEHPAEERIRLSYTLKRAFAYGQSPVTMALMATPPNYRLAGEWMAIGAGKAVLHGGKWLGLSLVRHPRRAFELDKAVRGFAKLFWFVHFRFYGNAAIGVKSPRPQAMLRPAVNPASTEHA